MLVTDPLTGEQRLLTPGRAARPHGDGEECPFCAGNESMTTDETMRVPQHLDAEAGSRSALRPHGWQARSFPNLYPLSSHHEVVVAAPAHVTSWRDLGPRELLAAATVLLARRARLTHVAPAASYVHAFLNDGPEAGGSLAHVHAQVVALPASERTASLTRSTGCEGCAICSIAARADLQVGCDRGDADDVFVAAHPAPRMGGALVGGRRTHGPLDAAALARVLSLGLGALEPGACNAWVVDGGAAHHAYVELLPRTARVGSVELALGLSISVLGARDGARRANERLAARA